MQHLPIRVLAKRFGNVGKRLWYMCQGQDPDTVKLVVNEPKSIGHGKVMPPNTTDRDVILNYLSHMTEKVAFRLRSHNMVAQSFWIGVRLKQGWIGERYKTIQPTNDGLLIYHLAASLIELYWNGDGVYQCQVTARDPQAGQAQLDLFSPVNHKRETLNRTMDAINQKFGQRTLVNAQRLQSLSMPDVIAPAWRPHGVRSTVVLDKKSG